MQPEMTGLEAAARRLASMRTINEPVRIGSREEGVGAPVIAARTANVFVANIGELGYEGALDRAWRKSQRAFGGDYAAFITALSASITESLEETSCEMRADEVFPRSVPCSAAGKRDSSPARSHDAMTTSETAQRAAHSEQALRQRWEASADLREEFQSFAAFAGYEQAAAEGRARIIGGKQRK